MNSFKSDDQRKAVMSKLNSNQVSSNDVVIENSGTNLALPQNKFYHATTRNSARKIVKEGFSKDLIGSATKRREGKSNSFLIMKSGPTDGDGFYVAKNLETAKTYGKTVIEVKLKDDAKILNLKPYWLKQSPPMIPFLNDVRAWYPKRLEKIWAEKNTEEKHREHYREWFRKNMDEFIDEIDPRKGFGNGDKFKVDSFIRIMKEYAEDHGYAGVDFDSTNTVIFSTDSIAEYRILK